ncbi:hypothetical protein ADK67_25700 [Saccharothrix sp. NRRL B-16348]|uniref:phosphopantetheine-binding protein n=1 Tax=Saccharothrix sp. NRRL B-16348 TaxID=1415542 RepID=UPI0006B01FB7|nr:phosphopantetheine-binding protein [Saccharothrix sp. NRRL B-16348]KOX21751.1 hypothetical protein ADK67_25700 [Saccharothrix sp. NRRL B-16348]
MTPSRVTELLQSYPGVDRVEVAVVRHDGRDVVVAAVQPTEYLSGTVLRNHVRQQVDGRVGVLVVDSLPVTPDDLAAALVDGRCTLFEDPRDDVERRVAAIWAEQLDVRAVGATDDFLELGGDSLSALGIISAVEAEFDHPVDVYEFMTASSVRGLAEVLRQR